LLETSPTALAEPTPVIAPSAPAGGITAAEAIDIASSTSFQSGSPEELAAIAAGPWQDVRDDWSGGLDDPRWVWRVDFRGEYERFHCTLPPEPPPPTCPPVPWKTVYLDYLTGEVLTAGIHT
jgi:hypothetical protein